MYQEANVDLHNIIFTNISPFLMYLPLFFKMANFNLSNASANNKLSSVKSEICVQKTKRCRKLRSRNVFYFYRGDCILRSK